MHTKILTPIGKAAYVFLFFQALFHWKFLFTEIPILTLKQVAQTAARATI